MKATRHADELQFSYSAQVCNCSPQSWSAPPNPGVPLSLSALSGGNAIGPSAPNMGMYGQNNLEGAGLQNMNNTGGNSNMRGVPQNYHASRNYCSPYGHPDLEYVYNGSPTTESLLLDPAFSIASNNPHFLQSTHENVFTDHPALETAPMDNFQVPFHPAQRFSGAVMENAQVQSPIAHGLYSIPTTPELQLDDLWVNLDAGLFPPEPVQQYNVAPGDIGMVEAFGFEPGPSIPAPVAIQHPVNCVSNPVADYKTWAILSQALPDVGVDGSSSSGQAGLASNLTGNATMRKDPQGFPSRQAQHAAEVAQNSNQGSYHLGVNESGVTTMPDIMDMVMEDSIPDGASSTEEPTRRDVAPAQIPHGYSAQNNFPGSSVLRDAGGQRPSRPENSFRDPQPSQEHREPYNASGASAAFNGGAMAMANDFTQLMGPTLSGIRQLGESRWAVQLLNLCAAAVASQNITRTQQLMCALNDLASVGGDVNQRFAAYGLRALYMRITNQMEAIETFLRPRHHDQEITFGSRMVHRALVKYHEHVPWHQNSYSASSQTLLEVCAGKNRLHLIDIGAGKGIEWPIFIDALVSRAGGPPSILRITMIKDRRREEHNMRTAKSANSEAADFMTRLVKFASFLGLHVEVNVIGKALEFVTREDLRLRHGEILAVVCQFRLHRLTEEVPEPPSNAPPSSKPLLSPRDEFLDFLFQLNPHVLIVSDNDMDHCPQEFLPRFQNAVSSWWSLFEALDIGYKGRDTQELGIIEYECGSIMLNMVACEGVARIERNEPYSRWSRRIQRAGFVAKDLSEEAKKVCQNLVRNHGDFWDVVFDNSNCVLLRWRTEPMTFTSVWATPDYCSKNSCKCSMLHN